MDIKHAGMYANYFLPPNREIIQITNAIIPTTTKTPTQTPALKIPSINSQLLKLTIKTKHKINKLRSE